MGEIVVKHNALINASYNLELTEQRLILLAIINARESGQGVDSNNILRIHASDYLKHFEVDKHAAYEALKNAAYGIFHRQFSYTLTDEKTGKTKKTLSRWVQKISYIDEEGILELAFTIDVVPLITQLEENFTRYQLKQVTQLTSKYAIRLYELLIAWRNNCKTPTYKLADFRNRLGVEESEYKLMHQFKSRVLDLAVGQINEHTDITAKYEQHKAGRLITGFSFTFKLKSAAKAASKAVVTLPKEPDPDTEKREAYAQFLNYQRQAKLLGDSIEQLANEKEVEQFREFGFLK